MIRIVFWAINISVHLVLTIELQVAKTCLVAPRCAVESFHYTTETHFRIVGNFCYRQLIVVYQLFQSLYGIERTLFVITSQDDLLRTDAEEITFVLFWDEFVILANRLVSTFTDIDMHTFFR